MAPPHVPPLACSATLGTASLLYYPYMKPKILFLITKSNFGGAQKYIYDLATSIHAQFEVSVALGGDGRLADLLSARSVRVHRITSLRRDVSLKSELRAFREIVTLLRREKPQIVHLNSSKAGALGALAARIARVPHIVFTAHGWAWNEDRPPLARYAITALHWLTVMLAHRTICVSHSVYDQMATLPWTRKRMRVIHLGITPLPHLSREQARVQFFARFPELSARTDTPWIATIAELHPIKGFPFLLDAVAELRKTYPNLVYIVMGDGEERAKLEETLRSRGLSQTVYLAGHIQDAPTLLPAFDVFALASFSESFGYVIVEAGAADVPVVATRVGGIPEIIEEDGGILVPPRNAHALYDALYTCLTQPRESHVRALTLKERVRTYFTKERMVEETRDLYRDLLRDN